MASEALGFLEDVIWNGNGNLHTISMPCISGSVKAALRIEQTRICSSSKRLNRYDFTIDVSSSTGVVAQRGWSTSSFHSPESLSRYFTSVLWYCNA